MKDDYLHSLQVIIGYMDRDRPEAALEKCYQVLEKYPDDEDVLLIAAEANLQLDNIEEASSLTIRCLDKNPNSPSARYLNFLLQREQEQHAEAEQIIIGLLSQFPDNAQYYAAYAGLLLKTGHVDKARQLANEALRIEPDHFYANSILTLLSMATGKVDKDQVANLVQNFPDLELTSYLLIDHFAEKGNYKQALNIAQNLLRKSPGDMDLVDQVLELKVAAHPLNWPMRPFYRWGWAFSGLLWIGGMISIALLRNSPYRNPVLACYLILILYSWTVPFALKKYYRRFGF